MSIDPLQAKFPFQSPYVYAGNSPLLFIDKNGEEAWIAEYNKTTRMLIERVRYENGKLYDKQGKEVASNSEYINEIKGILNNIKEISISVGDMITQLEQSDYIHNIQNIDPKFKDGGNINRSLLNGDLGTITRFNSDLIMDGSSSEASLSHELKHGYDRSLNQLKGTKIKGNSGEFIEAEWDAVNVQNQILFNQGKDLRKDYDGIEIPKDKKITPSKNDIPAKKVEKSEKPSSAPVQKYGDVILNTGGRP